MRTLYEGENRKQKRLKAITIRRQFQVYPGHYFKNGYDLFLVNRVARRAYFLLDSRLYPFLTPNGPGIPVFGYCIRYVVCIKSPGRYYSCTPPHPPQAVFNMSTLERESAHSTALGERHISAAQQACGSDGSATPKHANS